MDIPQLTGTATIISAIITIGLGVAFCFFGYRIFRILMAITGFAAGAVAGYAVVQGLITAGTITSNETLFLILGTLVGGAIGAVLLFFLYIVGVFLLGASLGYILASLVIQGLQVTDQTLQIAVLAVVAVIGGVLALVFQRVLLILATSISGAWNIVQGVAALVTPRRSLQSIGPQLQTQWRINPLMLVGWIVLAIAGIVVQFLWTGKKKPQPAPTPVAAPYGYGPVVAGPAPQVNVTVQQTNIPAQPAQPVVFQPQPAAPPPVTPVVVQPPTPAFPVAEEQPAPSLPSPGSGGVKYCPSCGQPLTQGTLFCTNCGSSVAHLWQ